MHGRDLKEISKECLNERLSQEATRDYKDSPKESSKDILKDSVFKRVFIKWKNFFSKKNQVMRIANTFKRLQIFSHSILVRISSPFSSPFSSPDCTWL